MSEQGDDPKDLLFTYRKGNHYRMIHVDGAHGALTPNGKFISLALFSERRTIPKSERFSLVGHRGDAHQLGPKIEVDDIGGVVREIEVCALMDIDTARAIHKWIAERLATHDKMVAEQKSAS